MRVDAIADPRQAAGWDVFDARTGLRFPKPIAYADDELNVIGIASICLTWSPSERDARITRITEVTVSRVQIDPVRRAILIHASEAPVTIIDVEEARA